MSKPSDPSKGTTTVTVRMPASLYSQVCQAVWCGERLPGRRPSISGTIVRLVERHTGELAGLAR